MENIYLIFVVALLVLAVADLMVGVGNDAVNFLNSAIGAKVAPFYFILSVAALGVLVGATFSSGMMEIARSGIFHPDQFYFSEIMIIFLAVMITDMILLDVFNTFGMPTSTTVSIIFEILGAAVAISLVKIFRSTDNISDIGNYINSGRALAIISGILLSVVIAFSVGALVQFITRMLFTFHYERKMPFIGAIWGSIAVTTIVYFLLVKGAKGASFITPGMVDWLEQNTLRLMVYSFIGFGIFFQLLILVFKANVLKIIVLIGTFSLAMAFAGNDLVNFIGVPLAGLESYRLFVADPSINPDTFTMEMLLQPVQTPTLFLLLAGFVMVLTLFFSKKARGVTKTEVDLARQSDGEERFSSSLLARNIVRMGIELNNILIKITPAPLLKFLHKRFELKRQKKEHRSAPPGASFDLLRASVNLFVASMLIALATSLKLPLSTTYVTFMVAMGTSFSDKSWGRESAVYRVTGVITVIGGWFFTAFAAFTAAFIIAIFISWGGLTAALLAIAAAFYTVLRTYIYYKKRSALSKEKEAASLREWNGDNVLAECKLSIVNVLEETNKQFAETGNALIGENRRELRNALREITNLNVQTKELKREAYITLKKLEEDSIESGHYYIQILDYLREIAHCLRFIAEPAFEYLDNNHPPLHQDQVKDLNKLNREVMALFAEIIQIIRQDDYARMDQLIRNQHHVLELLQKMKKRQIKLIKAEQVGTRNSMMYFNYLAESKNLLLNTVNMLKSHRDFVLFKKITGA
jgi:phosphate/sulfate permease